MVTSLSIKSFGEEQSIDQVWYVFAYQKSWFGRTHFNRIHTCISKWPVPLVLWWVLVFLLKHSGVAMLGHAGARALATRGRAPATRGRALATSGRAPAVQR